MKGEFKPSPERGDAACARGDEHAGLGSHPHQKALGDEELKARPRRSRTRADPVPHSSFISTLSRSQLPQAGPYGASEPRVSPSIASRDVLVPQQSPCGVTESKSSGAGTPELRVPRCRGSPRAASRYPPKSPQCPLQEEIAGREAVLCSAPRGAGSLGTAAVALGGPGPLSHNRSLPG